MSDETAETTVTADPSTADPLADVQVPDGPVTLVSLLSDEYKEDAALTRYNTLDDLAKSHKEAQRMISSSIRIPSDDTDPEKREAFYEKLKDVPGVVRISDDGNLDDVFAKLGRPQDASGYSLEVPDDVGQEDLAEFQAIAHKNGLNNQQAQNIFNDLRAGVEAQKEQMMQARAEAEDTLKGIWGEDYDNRLQGAKDAISAWDSKFPGFSDAMIQSGMGRNPAFLSAMSELGARVAEGKIPNVNANTNKYGMSREEAQAKIQEIKDNPKHAYWVGEGREQAEASKTMQHLYKIANS